MKMSDEHKIVIEKLEELLVELTEAKDIEQVQNHIKKLKEKWEIK